MTQHIIKKILLALALTCVTSNILAFTAKQQATICSDVTWWIFMHPNRTSMTDRNFRKKLFEQIWEHGFFELLGFDKSNTSTMYSVKNSILGKELRPLAHDMCASLQELLAKQYKLNPENPATKYIVWVALRAHTFKIPHTVFLPLANILIQNDTTTSRGTIAHVAAFLEAHKETPITLPPLSKLDSFMERRMRKAATIDVCSTE